MTVARPPALDEVLAELARTSRTVGRAVLSVTAPVEPIDPLALAAAAREADLEVTAWIQPAAGFSIVGIGRAWSVEPAGSGRFATAAASWRALMAGATQAGAPGIRGAGALLIGGLGFTGRVPDPADAWAPFGAASLVLPELAVAGTPEGTFLTAVRVVPATEPAPGVDQDAREARSLERQWEGLVRRAGELTPARGAVVARPADGPLELIGSQPDHAAWDRAVGLYAGAVGRGRIDKVVLARRVVLRGQLELDVANALRRLAATAPESTTYAFFRGDTAFVGATPERLAWTAGRDFETIAIAGSSPRGVTPAEDGERAAALLASDKEREEHAVVVDMLRASLGPLAERLDIGPGPTVLPLRHVQHLATPVRGRLRADVGQTGLLALGERLHPTPAVGGEPRAEAMELIAEHEGFDRGWYAGPIGWLGADGDGELMVALRGGIVAGRSATCFAGCGIVADSDAAREWDESRLKLRTLVSALGRAGDEVVG